MSHEHSEIAGRVDCGPEGCELDWLTSARLEVDDGPILAQETVLVLPDDTVESLHERIKEVERRLYPAVLRSLVERSEAEER